MDKETNEQMPIQLRNILLKEKANSNRNIKRLEEIRKFKKTGKLLEIGCGKGGFLNLAASHFDVEGYDICTTVGKHIYDQYKLKIQIADIESVTLKINYYDVVVMFNILEHLRNPAEVLMKVKQSLRDSGLIIGSFPNNQFGFGFLATKITNIFDSSHISTYKIPHWMEIFHKAKFYDVVFFGEVAFGANNCIYIREPYWKYISANAIFINKS